MQTRRQDEEQRGCASGCIAAPNGGTFAVSSELSPRTLGNDDSAIGRDEGDGGRMSDNLIVVYRPNDMVRLDIRLEFAVDIEAFNVQYPKLEVCDFHGTPYRRR